MPNPNKTLHINFNVLLDEETDAMLIRIAKETHQKKAYVVRQAIRNWAAMAHSRVATCANGEACRCPHAHIYTPAPLVEDPDRDSRNAH